MSRILYRLVAALARLAFRSSRSKDLEIIVLCHQLAVVRRQIDRPEIDDRDRTLLGAIAAALPRPSWSTPTGETLAAVVTHLSADPNAVPDLRAVCHGHLVPGEALSR